MQKLTNMEAQRVINCLEDAMERMNILSYLPESHSQSRLLPALEEAGAQQAYEALRTAWQLEEGYRTLVLRPRGMGNVSKAKQSASESAKKDLVAQLHQVVRNTCRQLKKNPIAMSALLSAAEDRSDDVLGFIEYFRDLTMVVHRKLSTTVEEESQSKTRMHELSERERSAEDERTALEQTLQVQRSERETELSGLDRQITKLRSELHDITQSNQMEMDSIRSQMKERMEEAETGHVGSNKKLQDKSDRLAQELSTESEKHREHEASLRKKKEKREADLAEQIRKYDTDMTQKQQDMKDLISLMETEEKELAELEEYFTKIDANTQTRENEERTLAEFKRRVAAAQEVLDRSATMFQAVIRGRKKRAELKAAGGKKKK